MSAGSGPDRAFLVGALDVRNGTFKGFGLFSEETPTLDGTRLFLFTALRGRGETYEEAVCDIGWLLTRPQYVWMRKHIDAKRSLVSIREVQQRRGIIPVLP